ncbi:MAG: hypothetical protein HC875_06695 [Anaerolineales bacterium]|nr:hypothetical protein [Anaerolineales bacterium]
MPIASEIIIVGLDLLVFGLLLAVIVPRLRTREGVDIHLTLYAGLGIFLNLSLLVSLLQVTTLAPISQYYTSQSTLLALILTFGALTLSFLKRERKTLLTYWSSAVVVLLLWIFLSSTRRDGPVLWADTWPKPVWASAKPAHWR